MTTLQLTKGDVETARGEIFHMILFAMAWVMIGEYAVDFRDHILPAIIVLTSVVILALYSISLYDLEENLPDRHPPEAEPKKRRIGVASRYAIIFLLEGVAVMATWMILIHTGHEKWLVPSFALIAGLHFFPLAGVIGVKSYYVLGLAILLSTAAGYWLVSSGRVAQNFSDAFIAYGCAAGAVIDGGWIAIKTKARAQ
jgi:hypothetical protein